MVEAPDLSSDLPGRIFVSVLVGLGSVVGLVAIVFPVNPYLDEDGDGVPDIVNCDITTGEFLVPSAVVLMMAIAIMLFRKLWRGRDLQWVALGLALAMLLGLAAKVPEWQREAARAHDCP
ncbi:MAG: hypothetical protein KC431_08970 [Myxococcales bacterium]|nr:hypothetical protein [Myxococcales bacterium]